MNNPTDSTALQPDDYKTDAEPTHFAKVLEIFTKPAKTFEQMSKFPPRTIDWFLPVLILSVLIIITPYVLINNNSIYYQVKQQQIERNQKTFNKMVEKEIMIQQADDKIIKMKFRMSDSFIADFLISHIIWSLFLLFIIYFVIAGFYFFIVTRVLKGKESIAMYLSRPAWLHIL